MGIRWWGYKVGLIIKGDDHRCLDHVITNGWGLCQEDKKKESGNLELCTHADRFYSLKMISSHHWGCISFLSPWPCPNGVCGKLTINSTHHTFNTNLLPSKFPTLRKNKDNRLEIQVFLYLRTSSATSWKLSK